MTTPAPEPEIWDGDPGRQPPAADPDRRPGHIPAGPREPVDGGTDWLRQIWRRW